MNTGRPVVAPPAVMDESDLSDLQDLRPPELATTHPLTLRALTILWPAFLMAGVLEMLTFVVVDPAELRWFGGELIGWSSSAVYTVTFLIYWTVISIAGALTSLLGVEPVEAQRRGLARHWP